MYITEDNWQDLKDAIAARMDGVFITWAEFKALEARVAALEGGKKEEEPSAPVEGEGEENPVEGGEEGNENEEPSTPAEPTEE